MDIKLFQLYGLLIILYLCTLEAAIKARNNEAKVTCKKIDFIKKSDYIRCLGRLRSKRNVKTRPTAKQDYFGNPCTSYRMLDQANRSVNHVIDRLHDKATCDRNLRKRWYRFSGLQGHAMPTSCVDENSCGTHSPIWLHGRHPEQIGDAVDAEVCASLAGHCCSRRWYIRVANCGDFFTYLLTDTPGCYMAYCAGSDVVCPDGTSSKTGFTPGCSHDFPSLEGRVKLTLNEHNPSITFHCDYEGRIAKGSYIQTQWFVQGNKKKGYSVEDDTHPVWVDDMFERRRSTLVEGYWAGRLGSTVFCRMIAMWKNDSGVASPAVDSNKYFAGIQILNRHVNVSESSSDSYIELQSTVPINCLPQFGDACKVVLEIAYDSNYMGQECSAGKMRQVVFGDCYVEFTPDNWRQIKRVKVKAVRDFYSDGNQVMLVDFRPIYSTLVSEMWSEYQLPPVEILAADKPTKICSSIGDPHYTTFDGHIYHVYMEGEFVLYKNTKLPIQINTRLEKCEKIVTCNCAVAVMVSDDVIVIDRCQKQKKNVAYGRSFPEGWNTIHRHALEQGDSFVEGLRLYEHDEGRRYTIHLPTGAFIDFKVGDGWVNIFFQASSDDWKNTLGFCGTFDGDVDNDFTLPDGVRRLPVEMHAACAGSEDVCRFADAWRVGEADSLFGELVSVDERSKRWLNASKYCQCQDHASSAGLNAGSEGGLAGEGALAGQVVCNYGMDVQNCVDELEDDLDEEDRVDKTESIMVHRKSTDKERKDKEGVDRRRKRSASDDSYDRVDDDDISQLSESFRDYFDSEFIYDPEFRGWEPEWPTPSGITELVARRTCREALGESEVGRLCQRYIASQLNSMIQACVIDVKVTDSYNWIDSTLDQLTSQCLNNIQNDAKLWMSTNPSSTTSQPLTSTTAQVNLSTTTPGKVTKLLEGICTGGCTKHGSCIKKKCVCEDGFGGEDCSRNLSTVPEIKMLSNGGFCDLREGSCKSISVYGTRFLKSDILTCYFHDIQTNIVYETTGLFETFEEILCPSPSRQENQNASLFYLFSIYNLTLTFSRPEFAEDVDLDAGSLVIFDSKCIDCDVDDGSIICTDKENVCIIGNQCFLNGERNPADCCLICNITQSKNTFVLNQNVHLPILDPAPSNFYAKPSETVFHITVKSAEYESCDVMYDVVADGKSKVEFASDDEALHVALYSGDMGPSLEKQINLNVSAQDKCSDQKVYGTFRIHFKDVRKQKVNSRPNCNGRLAPKIFNRKRMQVVLQQDITAQVEMERDQSVDLNKFNFSVLKSSNADVSISSTGILMYTPEDYASFRGDLITIIAEDDCANRQFLEVDVIKMQEACKCLNGGTCFRSGLDAREHCRCLPPYYGNLCQNTN